MYRLSGSFSSVATATTNALAKERLSFSFFIATMLDFILQNVSKLDAANDLPHREPTGISYLKKMAVAGLSRKMYFLDCNMRSKMCVTTVAIN